MTMIDARLVTLSISNGGTPEQFLALGGLQESEIEWLSQPPEARPISENAWFRAQEGAGPRSLRLSGSGLHDASEGETRLLTVLQAAQAARFRIRFGSTQTVEARFFVTRYQRRMSRSGLVESSLSLQSSGEVTIS